MGATLIITVIGLLAALVVSWFVLPTLWARFLLALAHRTVGLRSEYVTVNGIRWHYLRGGEGPVLVLVHGFGADGDNWTQLARHLKSSFTLIAPDLPGFGESDKPEDIDYRIEAQAQRLKDFLDQLDIQHCLMAGSSMGGYLTASFAQQFPDRVSALWLLAPLGVHKANTSHTLQDIDKGEVNLLDIHSTKDYRRQVIKPMFEKQPWVPYPIAYLYAHRAIPTLTLAESILRQVRYESQPLEEIAAHIQQPVLLQWGVEDQIVDFSGAKCMCEALQNCTFVEQQQTGHLPMLEKPAASAGFFKHFYQGID